MWLEGTLSFVRLTLIQTLAVIRTHLTNWDGTRGIFPAFYLIHVGNAWSPRMAKQNQRPEQCSNNGDVFTTHVNNNTGSMSATSAGLLRGNFSVKNFVNKLHAWTRSSRNKEVKHLK